MFNKEQFTMLRRDIAKLQDDLTLHKGLLKSMMSKCQHNWEYKGHTSHEDGYECNVCGETKWV